MTTWVRTYENGADWTEHLGGVDWNKARLPLPLHRCRPQTRGQLDGHYVERCRCGAYRDGPSGPWVRRNETRRDRRRKRREDRLLRVTATCRDCGRSYEAAEGTLWAANRQCDGCWADEFTRMGEAMSVRALRLRATGIALAICGSVLWSIAASVPGLRARSWEAESAVLAFLLSATAFAWALSAYASYMKNELTEIRDLACGNAGSSALRKLAREGPDGEAGKP